MTDLFLEPEDATPLRPGERADLLQTWITHRRDLNVAEAANIASAARWVRRRRREPTDVLAEPFVRTLHKRMFDEVWRWAGQYRLSERNIGIEAHRIPQEVASLLDDGRFWVANETFPRDEIAIRLHHRLVQVHPFPNGNGRHARLLVDILVESLGGSAFSWGGGGLADAGAVRMRYITALRAADAHDIDPLLRFARA